ncbi:hypothetical protein [Acinetobacter ursingii]|uniref:hypothetical protein n=1 Tax=Acinetobacter ursingii TaxID=108980 RepID=UPI00124FA395|nr:hypothetical protein [Acinetobacter ursingii]
MNEILNNNWFVSIVTGLLFYILPKFLLKIKYHFSKKGILGRAIRYFDLKRLRKIRIILQDDTKIQKETTKNYAYLIIFLLSMMTYFWLLRCLTILSSDFRFFINNDKLTYNIYAITAGFPVYIFELLYLNQKYFVDQIYKFRK